MKPMLASDFDENKLKFPLIAQPKIDGVRGLNINGIFGGRSLKQHANRHVTNMFSLMELSGLDGEVAAEADNHPDLCRITTSALSTIAGEPFVLWWLFDFVTEETKDLPYVVRLQKLNSLVQLLRDQRHPIAERLRIVPSVICNTLEDLTNWEDYWLLCGYEGAIIRDPNAKHKQGRSTVREGGLLRIKRFVDGEILVTTIIEGETNGNAAQTNELGNTFRSTHQENMVPNGMVGAMLGTLVKDLVDNAGNVLFTKGTEIKVGAGSMPHQDRLDYFNNPDKLIGKVAKFKFFPKGIKDKPRFPTFQTLRSLSDL